MEVRKDCIISTDSIDKYQFGDGESEWKTEYVQECIDEGLMTQDSIYKRFHDRLSFRLTLAFEGSSVIENIKQAFEEIKDPKTGYVREASLKKLLAGRASTFGGSQDVDVLYDIFLMHAFHPFPVLYTEFKEPRVDYAAFSRALSLILLDPAVRPEDKICAATHGVSSSTWGPHEGWVVVRRDPTGLDFLRRLFRSLSAPNATQVDNTPFTIQAPLFMWNEVTEVDGEIDVGQQTAIVRDEDERSTDILDVLSGYHTVPRGRACPFRQHYDAVLPHLPRYPHSLRQLHVSKAKVKELVKLVGTAQDISTTDVLAAVENTAENENISWETFEKLFANHAEMLADGLGRIFRTIPLPLDESPWNYRAQV